MPGCYGNHPEDRYFARQLDAHLSRGDQEKKIEELAHEKLEQLPAFYSPATARFRFTNMDDTVEGITQAEWIAVARSIIKGDELAVGKIISEAILREVRKQAYDEVNS